MKKLLPVFFIMLLAAVLRLWQLGAVPSSMNADEIAIGYNAYSILKTGKDEYGASMPLSFRSFDDYKAPLYIYLDVPFIAALGLTDVAVRLPSALAGILTVLFTYWLVIELFWANAQETGNKKQGKENTVQETRRPQPELGDGGQAGNKKQNWANYVPFASALLLAISPWHLQFSRSAYEANVSVMFITIGAWAFLRGLRNTNHWLTVSALSFALSMWSYHTPRIFVPLLLIVLTILYFKQLVAMWKVTVVALVIGVIVAVPMVKILLSPEGAVRAKGVSALSDVSIIDRSITWMEGDATSGVSKLQFFHNRRIEFAKVVVTGYLSHFDPAFFFLERAESKYRAPGMGLLYIFELPFLIAGLYKLMRIRTKESMLVLLWIALAPVAASPTMRLPHPVRTIVFLPALQILSGLGAAALWIFFITHLETIKRPWSGYLKMVFVSCFLFLVPFVFVAYYLHQYYVHLPVDYAADWQYGHKEVVEEVKKMESSYDHVIVSISLDQPQAFFLYYLKYDPSLYLSEGGTKAGKFDTDTNVFGPYHFTTIAKAKATIPGNNLYVTSATEPPGGTNLLHTIYYPTGAPAYILSN
jgi:hypothetical protein